MSAKTCPALFRPVETSDRFPLNHAGTDEKGRFSEEQTARILREADRSPVPQVAKKHGISEQTIHTWRQRFAGMSADDAKRLRLREQENTRLQKILAERDLEI